MSSLAIVGAQALHPGLCSGFRVVGFRVEPKTCDFVASSPHSHIVGFEGVKEG